LRRASYAGYWGERELTFDSTSGEDVTGQNSRILSQRLVPCQPLASACFVVTLRLLDTDRHDVDNPFDRLVREAPVTVSNCLEDTRTEAQDDFSSASSILRVVSVDCFSQSMAAVSYEVIMVHLDFSSKKSDSLQTLSNNASPAHLVEYAPVNMLCVSGVAWGRRCVRWRAGKVGLKTSAFFVFFVSRSLRVLRLQSRGLHKASRHTTSHTTHTLSPSIARCMWGQRRSEGAG
jgi:hypothetical protein